MSFHGPNLIKSPLVFSLFVDDFDYFAAPTPPGSEEMETENDIFMETEDSVIMVTE